MPWAPELFSAPVLGHIWEDERRRHLNLVPFFPGVMTGETRALVESFAGDPEVHYPVRGRIKGVAAFERFIAETTRWMAEHNVTVDDVDFVLTPERGIEELVLHADGVDGRVELPASVVADHDERGRIAELRVYFSARALTGGRASRPPLLQPVDGLGEPDVLAEYRRALAAGDAEAATAAFEPDGYVREPGGTHRGRDAVRAYHALLFAGGDGIVRENCTVTDDGRACAVEYNVVARGRTAMPPEAGMAVHLRGDSGRLAAARIYDDCDPALR